MEKTGRSPRGERGLKSKIELETDQGLESLPSRGAWIEMDIDQLRQKIEKVAPLAGSVD